MASEHNQESTSLLWLSLEHQQKYTDITCLLHVHKHTTTHKSERAALSPCAARPPVLSGCGRCGRGMKVRGLKHPWKVSLPSAFRERWAFSWAVTTFYLSIFFLITLFQANWSNLETTDDENDLHEEQNHRKCAARSLQARTFGNWDVLRFYPEPKIWMEKQLPGCTPTQSAHYNTTEPPNYCLHPTYCAWCVHKNKLVKRKKEPAARPLKGLSPHLYCRSSSVQTQWILDCWS